MNALDQIGTHQEQLQQTTLKQDRDFISKLGKALKIARRREITSDKIFEVEAFLEDLLIKVVDTKDHDRALADAVANAKSYASGLAFQVENEEKLNQTFFYTVYELGKKLEGLAEFIGALILPILLSNNLPWG